MKEALLGRTYFRLALLLLGSCGVFNAWGQDAEIRFPDQPREGPSVTIEMYWSSCNGYLFSSDLYDIHVVGTDVQASVDAIDTGGFGVCPPGSTSGWQDFQLPPLTADSYTLSILALPFAGGNPDPVGPISLFGTATFTVAAAPNTDDSYHPILSSWSALLLIVLSLLIGWLALRR